jgi:hypothetical protein
MFAAFIVFQDNGPSPYHTQPQYLAGILPHLDIAHNAFGQSAGLSREECIDGALLFVVLTLWMILAEFVDRILREIHPGIPAASSDFAFQSSR